MVNDYALPCSAILSQTLLSSTADREWSRLGHLCQPWISHSGNQGMLSLNDCSLPAEMQMCNQWRGFNLWRGKEGKHRGSQSGCSPLSWVFCSSKDWGRFVYVSEGTELRQVGIFLRGRDLIGQGLQMGWGPYETSLRVSLWGWERGIKSCENSLSFPFTQESWYYIPDPIVM